MWSPGPREPIREICSTGSMKSPLPLTDPVGQSTVLGPCPLGVWVPWGLDPVTRGVQVPWGLDPVTRGGPGSVGSGSRHPLGVQVPWGFGNFYGYSTVRERAFGRFSYINNLMLIMVYHINVIILLRVYKNTSQPFRGWF